MSFDYRDKKLFTSNEEIHLQNYNSDYNFTDEDTKYINVKRFQKFVNLILDELSELPSNNSLDCMEEINSIILDFNEFLEVSLKHHFDSKIFQELKNNQNNLIYRYSVISEKANNIALQIKWKSQGNLLNLKDKTNESTEISNEHSNNENIAKSKKILNLLQTQKTLSIQELEVERLTHQSLTSELVETTALLMESTLRMRKSVLDQNLQLDEVQQHAGDNMKALGYQRKLMNENTKKAQDSIFSGIGAMITVVILFLLTYAIIRIFPKP